MKKIVKKGGFLAVVTALLVSLLCVPAFADAADWTMYNDYREEHGRQVVVQATDGSGYLYLRTGAGMNHEIICNIYDGTVLELSASCEDSEGGFRWGNTYYNGRYGWVSLKHTVPYEGGSSNGTDLVSVDYDVVVDAKDDTDFLYFRSGPGMDYNVYCEIKNGKKLHITEECPDSSVGVVWGKTTYNGQEGWVSLKHTTPKAVYEEAHPTAAPKPEKTETPTPTVTATPTPTPSPTPEVTNTPEPTPSEKGQNTIIAPAQPEKSNSFDQKLLLLIGAAVALVLAAIVALIITRGKKK